MLKVSKRNSQRFALSNLRHLVERQLEVCDSRYIMSWAHVLGEDLSLHCVSHCAPIVFVVDDDISVRESLDLLIRCGRLALDNDFTLSD